MEEKDKYSNRRVNVYLNDDAQSGYRHLLERNGVPASTENIRALARHHLLRWQSVTQEEVTDCFPTSGVAQYQESIDEILALRDAVKVIRMREYADNKKYDEPIRVKLMRESAELQEVLQQRAECVVNADTRQVYDSLDVIGELADCGYYNVQDYAESKDVRDFLAAQDMFCVRASAIGVEITVRVSLLLTIAKYRVRVAHAGLKQRDRNAAIALERAALSEVMQLPSFS